MPLAHGSREILAIVLPLFLLFDVSNSSEDNPTCGTVRTKSGVEVDLIEGTALADSVFENLKSRKLRDAYFSPGPNCTIVVCGFVSFQAPNTTDYIGSSSDYADCHYIQKKGPAPLDPYNGNFNVSTISCAGQKSFRAKECKDNCRRKRDRMVIQDSWGDQDCALLFQEQNCNNCWFNSTLLSTDKEYLTSNANTPRSIIVRKGCVVTQNSTSIKRLLIFQHLSGVFQYPDDLSDDHRVMTSFLYGADSFLCTCDSGPKPEPSQDESSSTMWNLYVGLISGSAVLVAVVGCILWKRTRWSEVSKVLCTTKNNLEDSTVISQSASPTSTASSVPTISSHLEKELPDSLTESERETMEQIKKCMMQIVEPMMHEEDNSKFENSTLLQQFQQVCQTEFVLPRTSFMIFYNRKNQLGSGYFGIVHKGRFKTEEGLYQDVAIKQVTHIDRKFVQSFLTEIKVYQLLGKGHSNIVRFVGACCSSDEIFIITRFCENGSLKRYICDVLRPKYYPGRHIKIVSELRTDEFGYSSLQRKPPDESIPEELRPEDLRQFLHWAEQIADGMEYLTSKKIIHVDLALRNILLSEDFSVKICDFGLSRKCLEEKNYINAASLLSVSPGDFPLNSLAPELCTEDCEAGRKITLHVDIWAFGMTLWEMFSLGDPPFTNLPRLGEFLAKKEPLPQPPLAPNYVYEKLLECWNEIPHERPSFMNLKTFFETAKSEVALS